ncbi:iron uptake porin [Merismopedia glauca]|uniref:SLH domain-containing protein n=1 Tax=Merismopedia glauca CCAP 1448/3 TaxID=1296344 RepID=A0A2T1C5S5_9CYAN|nr:iron uptake porin [Merismopedia glauca]PSB03584.1 hypothetical protein C7B64_07990 [Merismopedia glauca CCAP 1448/3]
MNNKSQLFWHSLIAYPAILAASILGVSGNVLAAETTDLQIEPSSQFQIAQTTPTGDVNTQKLEQIQRYNDEGNNSLPQVTNVSQFSDVQSTDWAYEALSRVVEKYGCLQGYPDGTYRGKRALSRYEFAAGLNACLRQIEALIEAKGQNYVLKEDFEALQRLVEEFRTELATLGSRVDNLEGRTTFLEEHQFSTTTKLTGQAIFSYADSLDNKATPGIFGYGLYLGLNTSFNGQDLLYAELDAGNISSPINNYYNIIPNTFEGKQVPDTYDTANDLVLGVLYYTFPVGNAKFQIAAAGAVHSDYAETFNPYFQDFDAGNGALSTFASESSIYRIGSGAGASVHFDLNKIGISLGYLSGTANDPNAGGLFNGDYAALAQLELKLSDRFGLGLTYVRGNHAGDDAIFDELIGTGQANNPFANQGVLGVTDFNTNSYGIAANFSPSNKISLSGFVSFTDANADVGGVDYEGEVWSYGVGLALPDFGKEGNLLGIYVGVEPTLKGFTANGNAQNVVGGRDNAYHIEGFYKYQLTDNISITPGVIWLSSPGQNSNNDDAIIGTIRTTFSF